MSCFLTVFIGLSGFSCARHAALQNQMERTKLKAPLAQGEFVVRANSCSKVDSADFLGGGTAKFGSCYLTNLRFIYEESEWARTLAAVGKAVPTSGDFGMKDLLKGAYNVFNANYIIDVGNNGGLHVVERTGQIIIPLSDIKDMVLSGSRFSSETPSNQDDVRWLTLNARDGRYFIFEIYNLPPDKTGWMPSFENNIWFKEIQRVKKMSFK
jgi:hypothetical protein